MHIDSEEQSNGYQYFRELIAARYSHLDASQVDELLSIIFDVSHIETMATGMPNSTGKKIAELGALGLLEVVQPAEEINTEINNIVVNEAKGNFSVSLRHGRINTTFDCNVVINATGTNHNYEMTQVLPYPSLYESEHVKTHPLKFDLATDERGRMLNKKGNTSNSLYCVGPMRSAAEAKSKSIISTSRSIIRLRQQALNTALAIFDDLSPTEQISDSSQVQYYSFYKAENCDTSANLKVVADIYCSPNRQIIAGDISLDAKITNISKSKIYAKEIELTTEKMNVTGSTINISSMKSKADRSKLSDLELNFHNIDAVQTTTERKLKLWSHEGKISKWKNIKIVVEDLDLGTWDKEKLLDTDLAGKSEGKQDHKIQICSKYVHIDDANAKLTNRLEITLSFYEKNDFINAKAWLASIDQNDLNKYAEDSPTRNLYAQLAEKVKEVRTDDSKHVQKIVCYKAYLMVDDIKKHQTKLLSDTKVKNLLGYGATFHPAPNFSTGCPPVAVSTNNRRAALMRSS